MPTSRLAAVPAPARALAVMAVLAVMTAACSDPEPVAGPLESSSTPATSSAAASAPATTASGTEEPASAAPTTAGPPPTGSTNAGEGPLGPLAAPDEQSTAARSVAPPAAVVTLTSIAATATGGAEQITITSTGGVPGWSVRYVDAVRIDDEPVLTEGAAAVEIVLQAASPNGEQGLAPEVSETLYPDQPLLREVRMARYLADTVVFAAGLSRQVPFSVATTDSTITITFAG